jgi:glycerol uptake facilitator-like aquaporin
MSRRELVASAAVGLITVTMYEEQEDLPSAPIAVGITYAAAAFALGERRRLLFPQGSASPFPLAGPYTGASLNAIRTVAAALVLGSYKCIWYYVAATLLGPILGMVLYDKMLRGHRFGDMVRERARQKRISQAEYV